MTEFISDEEAQRIEEFTSVPRYKRDPEMLMPEETERRGEPEEPAEE